MDSRRKTSLIMLLFEEEIEFKTYVLFLHFNLLMNNLLINNLVALFVDFPDHENCSFNIPFLSPSVLSPFWQRWNQTGRKVWPGLNTYIFCSTFNIVQSQINRALLPRLFIVLSLWIYLLSSFSYFGDVLFLFCLLK